MGRRPTPRRALLVDPVEQRSAEAGPAGFRVGREVVARRVPPRQVVALAEEEAGHGGGVAARVPDRTTRRSVPGGALELRRPGVGLRSSPGGSQLKHRRKASAGVGARISRTVGLRAMAAINRAGRCQDGHNLAHPFCAREENAAGRENGVREWQQPPAQRQARAPPPATPRPARPAGRTAGRVAGGPAGRCDPLGPRRPRQPLVCLALGYCSTVGPAKTWWSTGNQANEKRARCSGCRPRTSAWTAREEAAAGVPSGRARGRTQHGPPRESARLSRACPRAR